MKILDDLLIGKDLTIAQASLLFRRFFQQKNVTDEFRKKVLVFLQKKGEHSNELTALVRTIRKRERLPFRPPFSNLVDGCGTGGDDKKTFNISTLACLVAAGAGAHIAKHGNRSVSSQCGSADILESLGVKIDALPARTAQILKQCGFAYLHAPLYHPLMAQIQPVRKELARKGIKTIFNLAGPLLNPLQVSRQIIGVYRKDLVPVMAETAKELNSKRAMILWNTGGFDELTTTHPSFAIELNRRSLKKKYISPSAFGFKRSNAKKIRGGNRATNLKIALNLLSGLDQGVRRDTIVLNAAALLYISGRSKNLREGIKLASQSINTGSARNVLKTVIRLSHDSR